MSSQRVTHHIALEAGGFGLFPLRVLLRGNMAICVVFRESHCDGELVVVIQQMVTI